MADLRLNQAIKGTTLEYSTENAVAQVVMAGANVRFLNKVHNASVTDVEVRNSSLRM
jgi:hypothetical protein